MNSTSKLTYVYTTCLSNPKM